MEKAKSKIEKQLSKKDKPAKSEIIDEDEIISEAPPTVDSDKLNKTFKDLDPTVEKVKKNLEDMSKINLEENYDAAEDMYDELIAQGYSNDEAAKEVAGDDKDLYNHLVGYSPDMDSDY